MLMPHEDTAQAPLYCFQSNPVYQLYCGSISDGTQFLLGPNDLNAAIVVLFGRQGDYLRFTNVRFLPSVGIENCTTTHGMLSLESCHGENVEQILDQMRSKLGAELKAIHVAAFFADGADIDIGVSALPWYLDRIKIHGSDERQRLGDDEFHRLDTIRKGWEERGDYVLTWSGDYHVSRTGEIVFS